MSEALQQPGEVVRPLVTPELAIDLLLKYFGLQAVKVKELNSYDDRNFYLRAEGASKNKNISKPSEDGYVMKIANKMDSCSINVLEAQNRIMSALSAEGIPCQHPVKSINGKLIEMEMLHTPCNVDGEMVHREHAVRLLTFIPGEIFDNVQLTPELLKETGALTAELHHAMMQLDDLPLDDLRPGLWNLANVPKVNEYVHAVQGDEHQKLMRDIINTFQQEVVPASKNFQDGIIHGDINEQNMLVKIQDGCAKICGILDWQDCCRSKLIYDLSILMGYMMFSAVKYNLDLAECGRSVLRGYRRVSGHELSEDERRLLPVMVAGRMAQSLVMGEYSCHVLDPSNTYALTTAKHGWTAVEKLWEIPRDHLLREWELN